MSVTKVTPNKCTQWQNCAQTSRLKYACDSTFKFALFFESAIALGFPHSLTLLKSLKSGRVFKPVLTVEEAKSNQGS